MKIYVSSVAFKGMTVSELGAYASEHNLGIEFSANFTPSDHLADEFLQLSIDRIPHNYFPPPKTPFVLNLASKDEMIRDRSIAHCMQGIELAEQCGAMVYSAHAGFCLDPDPTRLGKKLDQPDAIDRESHWQLFLDSCGKVAEHARKKGVKFLLENNVLMASNLRKDGVNPLLCVDALEIQKLLRQMEGSGIGFLLDTAHLKVSAHSLNFDLREAAQELLPYIAYVHHSDNDGSIDSNEPLENDYWFLEFMKELHTQIHVLEVKDQQLQQIQSQLKLLTAAAYE